MAAEMSTGILCMANIYQRKPGVSMLIVEQHGIFHKKATGKIFFTCIDGDAIAAAVEKAITSGNAVTIECSSKGVNSNNELVAEFKIIWSFKLRSNKISSPAA